jgi:sugar/nucleoside kinase (ribokinase family)
MIVCLGELLLDIMVQRGSGPERDPRVQSIDIQPGGSAANVAAWLAGEGIAAGFVGAVGQDPVGELLMSDLAGRGVTCAVVQLAGQPSGMLLLERYDDGAVRPYARRGANDALLAPPTAGQQQLLDTATWLHVTAYAFYAAVSRRPVLDAMARAMRRGARVSLDLGAPHLVHHIGAEAYVALIRTAAPDVLLANEAEASLLAGTGVDALSYLGTLAPLAILKRGQAGCSVLANNVRSDWPAAAAIEVEPLGAGDAFAAGLIAALHEEADVPMAVEMGTRLGARCVGLRGGRPPRVWGHTTSRLDEHRA